MMPPLERLARAAPALVHDEENVVVHSGMPVRHQLLVNVVLVEESGWLEPSEQVFTYVGDEVIRPSVGFDVLEC